MAIFQTYEPAADPVGDYHDVEPGDFGVHLMIGPPDAGNQPGFTGTILAALVDHVLADPAVQRIVVEPDARNARAIARPDKPARLAFCAAPPRL